MAIPSSQSMKHILLKSIGCTENDAFLSALIHDFGDSSLRCEFKPTNRSFLDFDKTKNYDALIFGSCTVAGYCDNFIIHYIKTLKKYSPDCIVIMTGCSINNAESRDRLAASGLVDVFCRTKEEVLACLKSRFHLTASGHRRTRPESQYVMVKSGCQKRCSYCIVPFVRKPVTMRSSRDILLDIRQRENSGHKTIILSGTCIGDWRDPDRNMNFAGLLRAILKTTSITIEGLYLNPRDFSDQLLEVFDTSRIQPSLSLPIQSGCDKTLRYMRRGYDVAYLRGLFNKIRSRIPDARLQTDIIIGFPTETKEDFNDTLHFLKEGHLHEIRGLIFSPRPMTSAGRMKQLAKKTKIARALEFLKFCEKHGLHAETPGLQELKLSKFG